MFVLPASPWSDVSREDTVGCTSSIVKAIAQLKDDSSATDCFANTTMHRKEISRSEVSPQHTVALTSQPAKEAIAHSKAGQQMKTISPLKGGACSFGLAEVQSLRFKLTIPSMTHGMLYESNPRAKKKVSNQNLPFMARRSFTSNSGFVQNSTAYGHGDTDLFNKNLKSAHEKMKVLDIKPLKAEFASFFRPLFVENLLMLPSTLEDHTAAYLHGQVHGFTKQWPLYLSSWDVMVRVKSCSKDEVRHLLDYIIQRRILISEDWDHTYGNIEVLRYDANTDPSFVRAECDAAFKVLNKEDGSGIAKLALLIWRGSNLIYADVIEGVECPDSVGAEVLAGLALLMKCKDMGFQKLELWSDSKRVVGVISGSESIYKVDPNRENCLLLRHMQTEFTELVPVFKPREIMFLTDHLLKLEGTIENKIEKALEEWSSKLKGETLFCVTNTKWTSNVIKSFAETRMTKEQEGYVYKNDCVFFWKVAKGEKFAAVSKLQDVSDSPVLYLVMDKFEEKPATLREMVLGLVPEYSYISECVTFTIIRNVGAAEKKPIMVFWDSFIYNDCYDKRGSCIIILAEDEAEVHLMEEAKIKEINLSTYLYINGVEFKEEEKNMSSKRKNRSKRGHN